MIQGTVDGGDTTSNIDSDQITAENITKPSGKMVILEKLLQKYQSSGHKVLVFIQIFCILDLTEDLLRIKQSKYERLYGSKSASHRYGAVVRFFRKSYQRFVMILRTRAVGLGIDLPKADTDVIFDHY